MPIAKLRALWRNIYESLWFLPAIFTVLAILAAALLTRADPLLPDGINRRELPWLFSGGPDGARGVLDAIASSFITITGTVFSITIVALQLASSQYTPRVLRTFMADRANQLVLAVFIGTFVYTMLVMRTIHSGGDGYEAFVPIVATTFAGILAIVSIGFLIFYIHHAARSLQADTIMAAVMREARNTIREEYPETLEDGQGTNEPVDLPDGPRTAVYAEEAGYLTALDERRLLEVSRDAGCVMRIEARVGDYIYPGTLLATLGADVGAEIAGKARDAFAMEASRTPHQDIRFSIIELVDIAAKALSPGINDPTTAMSAIDRIGELLLELGLRARPAVRKADDGATIITNLPDFDDIVRLSFGQVAHYGADHVEVSLRILKVIGAIGPLLPAVRRASLRRLVSRLEPVLLEPQKIAAYRQEIGSAIADAQRILA
ncbi:MAG: DUF2254 domain-containing protein [Longimicrobiales bacterium]